MVGRIITYYFKDFNTNTLILRKLDLAGINTLILAGLIGAAGFPTTVKSSPSITKLTTTINSTEQTTTIKTTTSQFSTTTITTITNRVLNNNNPSVC
jgi:hypothetical protein